MGKDAGWLQRLAQSCGNVCMFFFKHDEFLSTVSQEPPYPEPERPALKAPSGAAAAESVTATGDEPTAGGESTAQSRPVRGGILSQRFGFCCRNKTEGKEA